MFFAYTGPRYQVSVYRTIGYLVISRIVHQYVSLLRIFWIQTFKKISSNTKLCFCLYSNHTKQIKIIVIYLILYCFVMLNQTRLSISNVIHKNPNSPVVPNGCKSNRKAMNRNWSNQKANPALKTKTGNK